MKKTISFLSAMTLLCSSAMAVSVQPLSEPVRPGKASLIVFEAEEGTADITLKNDAGDTVSVIGEGVQVFQGINQMYWNGTWQGYAAPQGEWHLTVKQGEESSSTPVLVGDMAPCMLSISCTGEVSPTAALVVSTICSVGGTLTLEIEETGEMVASKAVQAGPQTLVWDGASSEVADGDVTLVLTLTDETGFPSTGEHLTVTRMGFDTPDEGGTDAMIPAVADEAAIEAENEAENQAPLQEAVTMDQPQAEGDSAGDEMIQVISDTAEMPVVFTPSYTSPVPVDVNAAQRSYWNTPMDITDEQAVWEMLMSPVTVIDTGKKNAEKTQVVIRSEPNEDADGVGVVTCITQSVRVLQVQDDWTKIETYSSSFHDSKVKAWNMLVQGWVPTRYVEQKQPSTHMGLVVDKLTQRLYVFRDGKLFSTLLCSTGLANARQPYNETRSGEFLLISKVGEFKSDNLACSLALRFNDGDLLHEVPHIKNADKTKNYSINEPKLGSRASHGCIRVQRKRTPEGVNMQWLWDEYKKYTKLVIWQDWQGRQIPDPDPDLTLYYNPNNGKMYHRAQECYAVKTKDTMEPFAYSQLDEAPYSKLTACNYCAPERRLSEIQQINENYLPGGDHDPIMTEAVQKYLDSLKKKE